MDWFYRKQRVTIVASNPGAAGIYRARTAEVAAIHIRSKDSVWKLGRNCYVRGADGHH